MSRRILGAVLAGGASSRFGSDKALAVVDGRTLLDRAVGLLAPVVDKIVVVGREGGVPDRPAPGLGPLGGIAGALDHAARRGFASVLTIACDMPAVPPALLAALLVRAPSTCTDAPVLGHWPASLAEALLDQLTPCASSRRPGSDAQDPASRNGAARAEPRMPNRPRHDGRLSVRAWARSIGALPIPSPSPIANVNTPADLAAL